VAGALLDHLLQLEAGLRGLARLQVREGQVDARLERVRVQLDELLVDGDGARVEPEAEVDDAEQVLPLGVARLEGERLLELGLRVVDAVVLEEGGRLASRSGMRPAAYTMSPAGAYAVTNCRSTSLL
jgi:hypothetical protein